MAAPCVVTWLCANSGLVAQFAMGNLFRAVVDAIYDQWRDGAPVPRKILLNAIQIRQYRAERTAGRKELGIDDPDSSMLLGVPIVEDEDTAGVLVTAAGAEVPLVRH